MQHKVVAEICREQHCNQCQKACYIDPGPPPKHCAFTLPQLASWASLIVSQLCHECVHSSSQI